MATRTVVCPDCDEPLTYGRLSCTNCGSLLASVAGAPRRAPLRKVAVEEPSWLTADDDRDRMIDEGSPVAGGAQNVPGAAAERTDGTELLGEPETHEEAEAPDAPVEPHAVERAQATADAPDPLVEARAGDTAEAAGDAPDPRVEAPVEAPMEAPADAPVEAPGEAPDAPDAPDAPVQLDWVDVAETQGEQVADDQEPENAIAPEHEPAASSDDDVDAQSGPAAASEPVPDPEASPDVEPVGEASPDVEPVGDTPADAPAPDDPSWVDLRVAAISGISPPATAAWEAAHTDEPAPSPDSATPDAAAEPEGQPVDAPRDEEPRPETVADEPAGAPADIDDAAEPPPPDVRFAGDDRSLATPSDGVLRPTFTRRTRLDVAAWQAASGETRFEALARDVAPHAPAGAWLPPHVGVPLAAPAPTHELAAAEPAATIPAAVSPLPGEVSQRAGLPLDAPRDLPTWFVAVGSGLATLGFLLPWSNAIPFAAGAGGYTDRWGLAVASNGLVLLAAVLLLGLTVVRNRLPAWVRVGVAPVGLGGILLGLVWPYVLAGSGALVGALVVTVAALSLVVGGSIAIRRARHPDLLPPV